jgi:mycothiol synthase
MTNITSRSYDDLHDHQDVMRFLRKSFAETRCLENWLPPRFENNSRDMDIGIRIWEDDREIIGLAVPESPLLYFIQLHPKFLGIYGKIVSWVEQQVKVEGEKVKLSIIELEGIQYREKQLRSLGYIKGDVYGILRIRDVHEQIPDYRLPSGFSVRSVTRDDYNKLAACIRQVFGHGDWFTKEILETLSQASFYKPDLDLVVIDTSGRIVSFCTFRLDAPSGITELEPMGTLRDYRGRGIGRALICEGLRRLEVYDPSFVYIGGAANTPAANHLYEVTGFTQKHMLYYWGKTV